MFNKFSTYINFQGNCREAMTFYAQCLGYETFFMPFAKEMCPEGTPVPEGIMHSELKKDGAVALMASDCPPGMEYKLGNNFSVAVGCESDEEIETLFAKLSEGGVVTCPVQDMFWGARFGSLTDKFGINWLFNYQKQPMPS